MIYACKAKDLNIRMSSTSGGFFYYLAQFIIEQGGVVAGAAYMDDFSVRHIIIERLEDICKLQKSKYVRSDLTGCFQKIKEILDTGRLVLFTGTPCQCAGLKKYVKNVYSHLICMDFICAGVCRTKIYKKYLEWLESKYHSSIVSIEFKCKEKGWHELGTKVVFSNGKRYFRSAHADPYMSAFIGSGLSVQQGCYQCHYRSPTHDTDFTVGDCWGIDKIDKTFDDNKGVSVVIIHSDRGNQTFRKLSDYFELIELNLEQVEIGNPTLLKPLKSSINWKIFEQELSEGKNFQKTVIKYGRLKWRSILKENIINFFR